MNTTIAFIINSVLLGVGLAMDAFSVSLANGLSAPDMKPGLRRAIPLTFAAFQFAMPVAGWLCVRAIAEAFVAFQRAIPWIALALLCLIGGKMLVEGLRARDDDAREAEPLTPVVLAMQGVATSIDALSVGFTIADYALPAALTAAAIIAAVTWVICACGLRLGRRFGTRLSGKASILGGVILIAIGLEILLRGA